MTKPRVIVVVGARPNFMKAAPVLRALEVRGVVEPVLLHTGQHYDERMSDLFFRDLGMPEPAVNLEVGSGSHAQQTADVMVRFEAALAREPSPPAAVVVVGDVNSTIACALVAAKAGILLAHVEAGLRSFDRGMPEELNRICTDQLADVCYVTEASGMQHLAHEGKRKDDCVLVGNTMIDTLLEHRVRAKSHGDARRAEFGLASQPYAIVTLHRPSNVDAEAPLTEIVGAIATMASRLPIVWPIHPRTRARMAEFGLLAALEREPRIHLVPPQGYLDFLGLVDQASLVLTDSGGVQEETTVLKVPCVTLRENTERPSTLEMGGNVLCGGSRSAILAAAEKMLAVPKSAIGTPPAWDGRAAQRIAEDLERRIAARLRVGGAR
ncbi:MAG: UDP-N-acetylglucosamine 2-epimerase (non-hydrolyzing) [Planctomycetes bacterium]|nr:UDP-N-acetylglucosamine 2-epimerase (non-hydrolyzing) [Planctomycetota bacterium]